MFHLVISKVDWILLLGTHLPQQVPGGGSSERSLCGVRRRGRRSDEHGPHVGSQNGVQARASERVGPSRRSGASTVAILGGNLSGFEN